MDLWSYGCLLFELATGKLPFTKPDDKTMVDVFNNIKNKKMNQLPSHCSEELKDLIIQLLDSDPQKRLGYENVNALLGHPFFGNCFGEDMKIKKNSLKKSVFNVKEKPCLNLSIVIPKVLILPHYTKKSSSIDNNYIEGFDYNNSKMK